VGRIVGATVLGYYVLAYKISQLAVDVMHKLIGRVAFPVFSQLQHDRERLRRAFDQILQIQMAVLIPLSVFTVAFAPTIVEATLGEKYQQSVLILQLLVLVTIGRGFAHAFSPIIVGTGNEQFASRIKVFETSLFLVAVWLGTSYWGAAGAALGAGLGYLAAGFARSVFVLHLTGFLTTVFLKRVGAPLLASLPGAAFVLVQPIHGLGPILKLIVVTCVFGVVYLLMSLALQKPLIAVVRNNLVSTRS